MNEKIAFIYLPFVAPMMPPLGIPVLISFLEKNGIKSNAYDLNVELYRKFLDENNIENGVCRIKHDLLEENCTEDRRYALLRFLVLEDYIKSNIKQAAKKMSPDGNIATHKELWMNTNIVSKAIEISTYGLWGLNTKSPINLSFEENFRDYIKIFSHTSWENYINWFHTINEQVRDFA